MKMKLKAEIIDENGKVTTKEIETEIPEVTEFGDPETSMRYLTDLKNRS